MTSIGTSSDCDAYRVPKVRHPGQVGREPSVGHGSLSQPWCSEVREEAEWAQDR